MRIRYDGGEFDTDDMRMIERMGDMSIVLTLDQGQTVFVGQAAKQIWAQVLEQAKDIREVDPTNYEEITKRLL